MQHALRTTTLATPTNLHPATPAFRRVLHCDWKALRTQLIQQWRKLTPRELEEAGPDPQRIARLIERKYQLPCRLVEYYLYNVARTLPAV